MNNNDMNDLMNQINQMLNNNNNMSDDLKNIVNNLKNSSGSNNENNVHNSNSSDAPEIDIEMIMKMKQIMDSMNSNKDDPRANLLLSLKPYLKKSRQDKVEQYVKLFSLGKAFELFNSLGGENKNDI